MPFILGSASGHLVLLIHAAMPLFVHEIFDYPSSLMSVIGQTRTRPVFVAVYGVLVFRRVSGLFEVDNLRLVGLRPTSRVSLLRTATTNISICPHVTAVF